MAVNTFSTSIQSLFDGMNGVLSTKSVVGEPITVNDTIIIPLMDVSFGMGAGSSSSMPNIKTVLPAASAATWTRQQCL